MRKTSSELNAIMKQAGVDRIWSWSKFNSFYNSMYEYFLKYILHIKEDRTDCVYPVTGGIAHDIMEKFYSSEIAYEDMDGEFEDAWLTAYEIGNLKFDRNDEEKDKKIADKYYLNLKHFFNHHIPINRKIELERFITIWIGNHLFQGYIDACYKDKEGNFVILDWKTSSIYKGKKAENECGQLLVYALGLNQMGVPLDKIKICWNFLKYVNVEIYNPEKIHLIFETVKGENKEKDIKKVELANTIKTTAKAWLKNLGKSKEEIDAYIEKLLQTNSLECLPEEVAAKYKVTDIDTNTTRTLERALIAEGLLANVKKQMKELKYSEEQISDYTAVFLQTNSLECLPEEVAAKYKVTDCYVYVPITDDLIKEWTKKIKDTLNIIIGLEKEYEQSHNSKIFMESLEAVKENSYYYATLMGYSPNLHIPYKNYLEYLDKLKEEKDNMFAGVGMDADNCVESVSVKIETDSEEEFDLSWLDNV